MTATTEASSTGTLTVVLERTAGSRPIAGGVVAVSAGGKVVAEKAVDDSGTARFTLAPGTYAASLKSPPPGWIAHAGPKEVAVTVDGTAEVTFALDLAGSLRVQVTDTASAPVVGATFTLKGTGVDTTLTTDESGRALATGLPPGDYVVTQTKPGRGHLLPTPAEFVATVPSPPDEAPVAVPVVNQTAGTIVLTVVDADQKGAKRGLLGATLVLSGPDNRPRNVTTAAGETTITDLAPGSYTVEEATPPSGFALPDARTQVVSVAAGGAPKRVQFVNARLTRSGAATRFGLGFSVFCLLALAAVTIGALFTDDWDVAFAGGLTGVGLSLLTIGRDRGFFQPLVGGDGRVSTSKTQVAIWTVAVVWALAYLTGRVVFAEHLKDGERPTVVQEASEGGAEPEEEEATTLEERIEAVLPADTWDDYLILLGGPFAAAVLAKGIVRQRVEDGRLQKTVNESGRAEITQAFRSDDDSTDLVDSQYLLFNVVALGYFVAHLATTPELPQIPPTLLALTSGAAALYVGNKAVEANPPTITGVVPATARPGERITIKGRNLCVSGASGGAHPTADLADVGPMLSVAANGECVEAVVPAGAPPGPHDLTVTTPAGVTTEAWSLRIEADQARITAVHEREIGPGGTVTVSGSGFRSPLDKDATTATVWIDDTPHEGTVTTRETETGERLDTVTVSNVEVPGSKTTAQVAVQSTLGARSAPVSVAVARS